MAYNGWRPRYDSHDLGLPMCALHISAVQVQERSGEEGVCLKIERIRGDKYTVSRSPLFHSRIEQDKSICFYLQS